MDAVHTLLKKTVLLLPLALFAVAPVIQAQPSFNPIGLQTITSTGGLQVQLGTSDGSTIAFTASIVSTTVPSGPAFTWLSVSPIGTAPGNVTVTPGNLRNLAGIFTAVVALHATAPAGVPDITFTASFDSASGIGGGGGGQGGTIVAVPATVPLSAAAGNTAQTTVTLSTGTSTTAVGIALTFDQPWLFGSVLSTNTVPVGGSVTLTVIANAATLVSNPTAYTGNLIVTPTAGAATTIPVTFTVTSSTGALTAAPNPVSLNFTPGSVVFPSQLVTLQGSTALTYTATPTSSNGWLLVNGSSVGTGGNIANGLAVSAGTAVNSLTTGTTGTILVQDFNGASVTITVNLTINGVGTGSGGGAGNSGGLSVAPSSLIFTSQGTNFRSVSRQQVAFTGPPGAPWVITATTTDGAGWLAAETLLSSLQADGTGLTTIDINPGGLVAGTYTGNVAINFSGLGTLNVGVTLTVQASPTLVATPGSAVFNFHTGDAALQPVSIFLAASDGSAVSATATTATPWLTVTQQAGASSFSIAANPTGMATGLYSGSVNVTSGLANSPMTIPVVLIVNGGSSTGGGTGGGTGPLTFNPASLSFSAPVGSNPNAQSLTISAAAATNFSVSTSVLNGNVNWLSVNSTTSTSGTTNANGTNVAVSVNSASLTAGLYNGTITFSANGVTQTVPVALTVTAAGGGGGNVTVTPAALTFSGQAGGGALAGQPLTVSGTASPVNFTVTTNGGSWLTTSVQSGATPMTLTVNVNITGLSAAAYNGNVVITPAGGNAVTIPVALTVTAAPTVSATPTSLTFSYRAGDAPPASQPVSVTGGGASLTFTATAASTGNWLVVLPATGTTPATVNVSLDPVNLAKLNASTTPYTGTVTISGSGSATGSATIAVSLTVTAPLPTVTAVTNAGSFAAGSISPGEIVTLFGTGIGPATPAVLALDTTGKVATTIGGVQVLVAGFACPMIFANATQISAVVPYELAGFTTADVLVRFLGQSSNAVHVNVTTTAPGLFTANISGKGPGAILNGDNSLNATNNPAAKGDFVVLYLTGEGQTNPRGVTGKVTPNNVAPSLLPVPLLPVSVLIGPPGAQQPANFIFAGEAPGFVSGAMQMNVQIPLTLTGSGDMPIVVTIGGNQSQAAVTVSVK